jgi:transcriptional regulator with XRE-family HTH domain
MLTFLRSVTHFSMEGRSGVSYNTIWRLEDVQQGAHPRTIRKLAEALGVQPSELLKEGQ